jgi:6-phosphofructokinase 1
MTLSVKSEFINPHMSPEELAITSLGQAQHRSPLKLSNTPGDGVGDFVSEKTRVLAEARFVGRPPDPAVAFEAAGPRERIYFDPAATRAAVVTCGGLCPGLNNVIRGLYYELAANYGVPEVLGIRYGYRGLTPDGEPPRALSGDVVEEIHKSGGTILGTSRGHQDPKTMVDFLVDHQINVLFCVGGDGTQRGAHLIAGEALERKAPISVIGIPKTIDNDIPFVEPSFGYSTALEKAMEHVTGAHNEACAVPNGVGLVKLMGRHAGFIAAGATIASSQVNFTLVPEISFHLDGPNGLLEKVRRRLEKRRHAVVVVAEGAGQHLLPDSEVPCDASGNRGLVDIGPILKQRLCCHFDELGVPLHLKYFDPSYHIRSARANCTDAILCNKLACRAVHAAMAGKTDMLVGLRHDYFIHVPLPLVAHNEKRLDPESDLWMGVLAATGQEKW